MKHHKHWAIHGSEFSMGSLFFKELLKGVGPEPFQELKGKKGACFSNKTLNHFIREEALHDDYTLSHSENRSIRTFSSGEQKNALIKHLLAKKPDFLILENIFDMLDASSRVSMLTQLDEISKSLLIIQIFRRDDELLPFINTVVRMEGSAVLFSGSVERYRSQLKTPADFFLKNDIPPSPVEFDLADNPLIRFKNISVSYNGKPVLNNISWDINKGDFWQLSGPNGSGKTTLLTMITGNNPKAYGQDLTLFGKKKGTGESVWDIKKKVGYVTPAMTVLFDGWHTIENMVVSGLYDSIGQYKKASPFQKDLAVQWIEMIGLSEKKGKKFSELSEEQQCMILIARSMIKHPPVLILDEPSRGLSDFSVSVLTALVNKIAEESRTTIIYVSHRKENGLSPSKTFELLPGKNGSEGVIQNHL